MSGGNRRIVLGRSAVRGEDHRGRSVRGAAGAQPEPIPGAIQAEPDGQRGEDRPKPSDERDPEDHEPVPGEDALLAYRTDHRGTRHRARQDHGAPQPRRGNAPVHEGPHHLLRGTRQDPEGHGFGILRPHDRRPHGPLRGAVHGQGRLHDLAGEGKPIPASHRRLQEVRRILSRVHRRTRRRSGQRKHPEGGVLGVPRARNGSHLEDRCRRLPRLPPRR